MSGKPEFPDLAPWAERRRQGRIRDAREFLAQETDWGDRTGPRSCAHRLGYAEQTIRLLLEELEGEAS